LADETRVVDVNMAAIAMTGAIMNVSFLIKVLGLSFVAIAEQRSHAKPQKGEPRA